MRFLREKKGIIISFIIGVILASSITVYATSYFAKDIKYTDNKSVADALNDLYTNKKYNPYYIYNKGTFGEGYSLISRSYHTNGGTNLNEGITNNPTITSFANSIKLELNTSNSQVGQVYINNSIDFSKYDIAVIHFKNARIYHSGVAYQSIQMNILDKDEDNFNIIKSSPIVSQNGTTGADVSVQNGYSFIDLSNINSNGYLSIYLRSYGSIEIDQIFLLNYNK